MIIIMYPATKCKLAETEERRVFTFYAEYFILLNLMLGQLLLIGLVEGLAVFSGGCSRTHIGSRTSKSVFKMVFKWFDGIFKLMQQHFVYVLWLYHPIVTLLTPYSQLKLQSSTVNLWKIFMVLELIFKDHSKWLKMVVNIQTVSI